MTDVPWGGFVGSRYMHASDIAEACSSYLLLNSNSVKLLVGVWTMLRNHSDDKRG